jgi:cytochrome c-type biogenesis protein CcmH/NrfG
MIRFSNIFIVAVFLFSSAAFAADLETIRGSLTSGKYDLAIAEGQLLGDTEGLLLAAEALNTKILIGNSEDEKADAEQAMAIAEKILAVDPDNKDAKLLYAISYGFYGRSMSPLSAWRKKMPQKIRAKIEEAVAANPADANSYALYGGWHMAVAAKAGTKRARKMFGATADEGKGYFKKALDVAPDDLMINGNFVMMLYASDGKKNEQQVRTMLKHIESVQAQNDAEKQVQALAKSLETNLDQPKKAKTVAKDFLGW